MRLLKAQQAVAKSHFENRIFLEGIAGTGKTTAAIERVKQLIRDGVAAETILVMVPQAALGLPYRDALKRARVARGGDIGITTLGKLAFEMVNLFFPLIAERVMGDYTRMQPQFLSLELVQYYMTRFIEPEIERQDFFNSLTMNRHRLYTQVVDNLNKAALVGFPHTEIGERLKAAWRGDPTQNYIYEDSQETASLFRAFCEQHLLLDFSMQIELFKTLWKEYDVVRHYLTTRYRHLIVDNIEEESPVSHDLLRDWMTDCESALFIYDLDAGYRRFLGADPVDAYRLKTHCDVQITLDNHRVMSDEMIALQDELAQSLRYRSRMPNKKQANARDALRYADNRYHPQMINWVTDQVAALIHHDGVSANDIVILAPFLPDALKYALQVRLDELKIAHRSHRPSRALREEPAARTLLTLAKVAHPQWGLMASTYDLAYALTASLAGLDLIRARLISDNLYRGGRLQSFGQLHSESLQTRITFEFGNLYDRLYDWLLAYQAEEPLHIDGFFSTLFGEILSQPHFGFHGHSDAAHIAANLIDSARQFRQAVSEIEPTLDVSLEYVKMVDRGVIANQYIRDWDAGDEEAVLIAPAYTFLLSNQAVGYQFWLNVGSAGWSQRLYQPLTHPYVLSRQWDTGRIWTDFDEHEANQETLARLTLGLVRRCRQRIYLGISEFGEQGYEQRGPLLMAIQSLLRRLRKEDDHV